MRLLLALCILFAATRAEADEDHAVYVELLGKGGVYGAGYDVRLSDRLTVGAAASFLVADDERIYSFSPYLGIKLVGGARHAWFTHVGPQLVHVAVPSPVPEWDGTSSTGIGVEVSSGWEYRNGVLLRVYGMGVAGEGGVVPWLGASFGWTL